MLAQLLLLFWLSFATATELYPRQQSLTRGSVCGVSVCVNTTVNGSTTSYVLSTRGSSKVGWMAIGFGSDMVNTPMVIMWMNSDGTATLSQRKASRQSMPAFDSNPPRKASLDQSLSVLSTSNPVLAFDISSNSDTSQHLIYAMSPTNPGSSAVDATLVQHTDHGLLTLALSSTDPYGYGGGSSQTPSQTPTSGDGSSNSTTIPFLRYQKIIIAHAVFCSLGFLVLLPIGALLARYMRTFTPGPVWFRAHSALQFVIAGPMILIGVILGISGVSTSGAPMVSDTHKILGIVLFILYIIQLVLGAIIHRIKSKNRVKRPPQNYIHAVFGLAIIALSGYQVHLGYDYEWPTTTGRGEVPSGVNIFFWIWIAILAAAYIAGLAFLPKQYRQERQVAQQQPEDYSTKKNTEVQ